MPTLDRITVFPVKSLDGYRPDSATVGERGALELDREYAMVDADGEYVNGKATAAVHRIESSFDPGAHRVTLDAPGMDEASFVLADADGRAAAGEWLTEFFGYDVTLRRDDAGGYPDDEELHGPTVVSTGTLQAVASWFDVTVESARRRFRASLEVSATDADGEEVAFWEDRLFADHGEAVPVDIGDVSLHGVNPCQRCVVPSRDPDTGAERDGFRETFVERRQATLPAWTDSDRFDHPFRLMVNTVVPEESWGRDLRVGDTVTVGEVETVDAAWA